MSSTAGAGIKSSSVAETGKTLPHEVAVTATTAQSSEKVNQAVAELNSYIQNEQRDLMFHVDEDTGDTVVRVVDRSSGDLIRQIPNDVVLDLAAKARDNEPLQLISMQG
ncbi:flagellar protein FlaG [Pseudomaricurvus sp.]|uniref:flagellar protein FlaG n=1 Tax=Pseudomaricurvus sp. TaxID=2004510 RepID=UPI003F6C934A